MEKQPSEGRFLWPVVAVVCACIVSAGIFFGLRSSSPAQSAREAATYPREPDPARQLATADVHLKCPNLEAAIRRALRKTEGTITRKDLASLEEISAVQNEITDLTGLDYATNLTELWLVGTKITDVTPLANLTKLIDLGLHKNQNTDITPLANLTKLTWLDLEGNQIADVTPLANLTKLTKLWLRKNQIADDQKRLLNQALPNCWIIF